MNKSFECPYCKRINTYNLIDELNDEHLSLIFKSLIFKHKCIYCKHEFNIEYPVVLISDNYIVSYKKEVKRSDKKYLRMCNNYDDFKEKALIFSNSLDDILIEFIKDYIKGELNDTSLNLRFDSIIDEKINFYDLNNKKNVVVSIEFYNNMLKHVKIKKIKKMMVINDENYIRYLKVTK